MVSLFSFTEEGEVILPFVAIFSVHQSVISKTTEQLLSKLQQESQGTVQYGNIFLHRKWAWLSYYNIFFKTNRKHPPTPKSLINLLAIKNLLPVKNNTPILFKLNYTRSFKKGAIWVPIKHVYCVKLWCIYKTLQITFII